VKQFPLLFDAIANGELHLTGLLMLGPHLTPENHIKVLGRAKFRTKKELAKLVRELSPLPQVPDLIEPLRPERALLATTRPSWEHFISSFEPPVRDLKPGERPREWANDDAEAAKSADSSAHEPPAEPRQRALTPRQRGRYVAAADRRAVFERDGRRCSYVDSHGGRCRETRYLELHHLKPFAQGGANLASNLTLRCAAHNALAAEEDFGREHMEQKRAQARHESRT
jgi:hypothetical protein